MSTGPLNHRQTEIFITNFESLHTHVMSETSKHSHGKSFLRIVRWLFGGILLFVLAVIIAIYLPFVQDFVFPRVLKSISSEQMDLSAGKIRLTFPADVDVENFVMKQNGDTAVKVGKAEVSVNPLGLLIGKISVSSIGVKEAEYSMGNADSMMMLRAGIKTFDASASIRLSPMDIEIGNADADGIKVFLGLKKDTLNVSKADSTAQSDMRIAANVISLRNVDFTMKMEGSIDSLGTRIGLARLSDGDVLMKSRTILARKLEIDSISAAYIFPVKTDSESTDTIMSSDSVPSVPWTIRAAEISLTGGNAIYAAAGSRPLPGLDLRHIEAREIDVAVDSFYNRGSEIRVPIKRIHAEERCGLIMTLSGLFAMDSSAIRAENILLATGSSDLSLDALIGMGDILHTPSAPLSAKVNAEISPEDIRLCYPQLSPILKNLPKNTLLTVKADADGSMEKLDVDTLDINISGIGFIKAKGSFNNLVSPVNLSGNLTLSGRIRDGKRVKSTLTAAKLGESISIPNLSLDGRISARGGKYTADLKAVADSGRIALDGSVNTRAEHYDVRLKTNSFPVSSILPTLGLDRISADIDATGTRFNPLDKNADLDALVAVRSASFRGREYHDINIGAKISDGNINVNLNSPNRYADFNITAEGSVLPEPMDITVKADINNLDLHALGIMTDESFIRTSFTAHSVLDTKRMFIKADADIASLDAKLDSATAFSTTGIRITFDTDSMTSATLANGDLDLKFFSPESLDSLLYKFSAAADTLGKNYRARRANFPVLRNTIPVFGITIDAGPKNILGNFLSSKDMSFKKLSIDGGKDSVIYLNGKVVRFTSGTTLLDTITLNIKQIERYLTFDARLDNAPGTMDGFAHVEANGYIVNSKAGVFMRQSDIKGKIGYRFGATAEIADSIVKVSFVPYTPVIGYKDWSINSDNFISLNLSEKHLDANLLMKSDESSIHLYTVHNDSIHHQEDINLKISDIKLSEWLSLNPFAPQIKGDLNADIRLSSDHGQLTGKGTIGLNEFFYGGKRVGSFDLDVNVTAAQGRKLRADVSLLVDSVKTITAYGHLNDSTSENPFLLDFKMIRFPLSVVNPFLPPQTGTLTGTLNGQMDITGEMTDPVFNGFIDFDSTAFYIDILGSRLNFSDTKIPVDSNVVSFENFAITAANKNPLLINGTADLRNLAHPRLNISLNASDMQLINTSRAPKNADMYGKAFIDLDATAKGELSDLNVDAALKILAGTKVTYIVPDATNSIESKSNSDMVRFVNFNDSTEVLAADSIPVSETNISINALLTIEEGTTINVDLSAGSSNKLSLQPAGTLDFSMSSLNPARLQGRININNGSVSYTPPFMSAKNFTFQEGSYISFTGAMTNPNLNIHAIDNLKANVTQSGQDSRLVTFNILLGITGTLDQMNVGFDLSTNDDITIQNELASMSAEQRANQAMNLLLYNMYTGPGTKGNANIGGNALYSFLESQVNTWAANNIRGVDLSFGIDQYDQTTNGATSKTTSYSYRISKSLFNDRFKIVVGGAYTDDNDPNQNVALNLINDISLEYMLNKNGTMVIKIFRHTGYESILEGEITQTGIGFVYKRKIDKLIDLFKPFRRKKTILLPDPVPSEEKSNK